MLSYLRKFSADMEITDVDKLLIQQLLKEEVVTQAVSFDRFIFKNVLFHTSYVVHVNRIKRSHINIQN